jgi:hypothetical protein
MPFGKGIGSALDDFPPNECLNYFRDPDMALLIRESPEIAFRRQCSILAVKKAHLKRKLRTMVGCQSGSEAFGQEEGSMNIAVEIHMNETDARAALATALKERAEAVEGADELARQFVAVIAAIAEERAKAFNA